MKTILEIIKKKENNTSIGLFSLKENTTYEDNEIFINPERNNWSRINGANIELFKEKDYRKVVAFNLTADPAIRINDKDAELLNNYLEEGKIFLEVKCGENGYPIVDNDRSLIIYQALEMLVPNITPAEALERIKQFNENFTNNHKFTSGLH